MFAIAAAETPRGWANTLGIIAGIIVIAVIVNLDNRYQARWGKDEDPSPTETGAPLPLETSQVRPVSSHVSPDETPPEPDKTQWWGSIRNVGGTLKRVYHDAGHIARTGDSPVRAYGDATDGADVEPDDMLDLPLADEDEGPEMEVRVERETREEYVERCLDAGLEKAVIAEALIEHYGLSRATAYRVVKAVMSRQQAA